MDDKEKAQEIIETGSEISGGVASTALGMLIAGLPGAFGGAVASPLVTRVLTRVCSEIYDRVVGPRERIRMGATAAYSIARIGERLKAGDKLRDDEFFDCETSRSSADEIFEGCLLNSKKSHEEKKAIFYGELFASIAFNPFVSRAQANHLLAITDSLTYQQLVLIALLQGENKGLRNKSFAGESQVSWGTISAIQEIYSLYQLGLVQMQNKEKSGFEALLDFPSVVPGRMILTSPGKRLYSLMRLDLIPESEIRELASLRNEGIVYA